MRLCGFDSGLTPQSPKVIDSATTGALFTGLDGASAILSDFDSQLRVSTLGLELQALVAIAWWRSRGGCDALCTQCRHSGGTLFGHGFGLARIALLHIVATANTNVLEGGWMRQYAYWFILQLSAKHFSRNPGIYRHEGSDWKETG